jgi:hypothetical protein
VIGERAQDIVSKAQKLKGRLDGVGSRDIMQTLDEIESAALEISDEAARLEQVADPDLSLESIEQ